MYFPRILQITKNVVSINMHNILAYVTVYLHYNQLFVGRKISQINFYKQGAERTKIYYKFD